MSSKVELQNVFKNSGLESGSVEVKKKNGLVRPHMQHQTKLSAASEGNDASHKWCQEEAFEFHADAQIFSPGQEKEQLFCINVYHGDLEGSNSSKTNIGSYCVSLRSLHQKFYSSSEATEVSLPLRQEASGADSCTSTMCTVNRLSVVVAKIWFEGDWSAHLEVNKMKEVAALKEAQAMEAKFKAGISVFLLSVPCRLCTCRIS